MDGAELETSTDDLLKAAARTKYADDPETLEIAVDTKAKVSLGEYSQGKKREPTATAKSPKRGGMIRPRKKNGFHSAC